MGIEMSMIIATSFLDAYNVEAPISCSNMNYIAAVIYGIYALLIFGLRPYATMFDQTYFGAVAIGNWIALGLGIIQIVAKGKNDGTVHYLAVGVPVVLQYVTLLRSLYDIVMSAKDAWQSTQKKSVDSEEVLGAPLLRVSDPEAHSAFQNPLEMNERDGI